MKTRLYIRHTLIFFVLATVCATVLLTEREKTSDVVFDENVRPGIDRLFVSVRAEVADSLFTALTGGDRKTARIEDGRFVVRHSNLGDRLVETRMGDGLWHELCEIDPELYRSSDGNELRMGVFEDEKTGVECVRVPAGLFSLFIK